MLADLVFQISDFRLVFVVPEAQVGKHCSKEYDRAKCIANSQCIFIGRKTSTYKHGIWNVCLSTWDMTLTLWVRKNQFQVVILKLTFFVK